jgi:DNA-binding NarL/FixJ family response regulator
MRGLRRRSVHEELSVTAERRRIIARLHDVLGQELTLLVLECDLALAADADGPSAPRLRRIRGRADRLVRSVAALTDGRALTEGGALAGGTALAEGTRPAGPEPRGCPLTGREIEVLRLAATGISISELAKRICLAEGTVRNLVSSSMKKLNARNRFDAARIALQQGLL